MHVLHRNDIVDVFVWVDDNLPKQLPNSQGGRPAKLTTSETVTILLFSSLTAPQKLLKGIWRWAQTNHSDDFTLPSYSKFVEHGHRALPALCDLLQSTLAQDTPLTRGTDTLAFTKDAAAYYGGTIKMWKYFEQHAGDELMLSLALMGKIDPTVRENLSMLLERSEKSK